MEKGLKIGIAGMTNAGKSTFVNNLFGKEVAKTSRMTDTTKEMGSFLLTISGKSVEIIDSPGYGGGGSRIDEIVDGMDESDLILHLINAKRGVLEDDIKLREGLTRSFVFTLLTHWDFLDSRERDESLSDTGKRLEGFITGGIELLPVSFRTGENLNHLVTRLSIAIDTIGKHSNLIGSIKPEYKGWIKRVKEADSSSDGIIAGACIASAAVGLIPLPFGDIIPLTGIQMGMVSIMAGEYGFFGSKRYFKVIFAPVLTGLTMRTIFRQILKPIPIVGQIAGPALAFSATYALGRIAKSFFRKGARVKVEEYMGRIDDFIRNGREEYERMKREGKV